MAVQPENPQNPDEPPLIFISYSHKDEVWKDRLRPHLGLLERDDRIIIWDDRQIEPTAEWYDQIKRVMARASIAVCLISADYLNSEFCTKEEIPYLLRRRKEEGMHLFLVLLRPCAWQALSWLKTLQMLPRDGKAVASDFRDDWDTPFAELARYVFGKLPKAKSSRDKFVDSLRRPPRVIIDYDPELRKLTAADVRIDVDRLPATGAELFGRQQELTLLDDAWASGTAHVVSLVAWGGVGKSTLINKWLESMRADTWRGAKRVYGWSFHSQGMGERVVSTDEFIADALRFFGDPDPTQGSPWSKGGRLAELARKEKTLLVLDGLEPLQSRHDFERGRIRDPGLGRLIEELAHENSGLCVITTRERVADLDDEWRAFVQQVDLEQISPEAGRALLRVKGVRGSDAELEQASRDFGNNALAIDLLASYLRYVADQVHYAREIPNLEIPDDEGRHPRRVMEAFARRFGEGPELDLLRVLGLFDGPADARSVAALLRPPAIPGLTSSLCGFGDVEWLRLVKRLRAAGLIAPQSQHLPALKTVERLHQMGLAAPPSLLLADELDAHPLVREHFGARLKAERPEAWRAGHGRLYEHLRDDAEGYPDTLAEMVPLFRAMHHGCQAARAQEALVEVYLERIQRGEALYNWRKLGAFSADLAALAGLFDPPWDKPVAALDAEHAAVIPYYAAFDLRALGRLRDAVVPMRAALERSVGRKRWLHAAQTANDLSELHLTLGNVAEAVVVAEESVAHAVKSGRWQRRNIGSTTLADALHQGGEAELAQELLEEAEALQAENEPMYPRLYSLQGYRYCDLLLAQGRPIEVRKRAQEHFEWRIPSDPLLTIALDYLSLGRAALALGEHGEARAQLDQAVDGLRWARQIQELPRGLLARAALFRDTGDVVAARRDLDEAMRIAERGKMRLFECDGHLAYARLALAEGDRDKARGHVAEARRLVDETGYGRRRPEVDELETQVR
jgi:tetratricopeptide (TPR) repeat protein